MLSVVILLVASLVIIFTFMMNEIFYIECMRASKN